MTTKLTLTVEEEVISKAKKYARSTGRSLSELVENYLEELTRNSGGPNQLSPNLKKLLGSVKLPADFDEKKELKKMLKKKYL